MPKKAPLLFRYEEISPSIFGSNAEYQFAVCWIQQYPSIDLHTQHRFYLKRRYTLDFAHLPSLTGIEIQGGTWCQNMGHSTGKGIRNDIEKIQLAASLGWSVIQIASDHVCDPEKLASI
ncbi:MAG: hypothetical protein ACKO2Z_16655, partial [Sphaerospermopsis kisseleviana]